MKEEHQLLLGAERRRQDASGVVLRGTGFEATACGSVLASVPPGLVLQRAQGAGRTPAGGPGVAVKAFQRGLAPGRPCDAVLTRFPWRTWSAVSRRLERASASSRAILCGAAQVRPS
jgi:hypothetical protein